MAKFRKKPVVVEAVLWNNHWPDIEPLLVGRTMNVAQHCASGTLAIETLEGTMTAQCGDWIIKGVNGELYPCKPEIFAKTYEPVD
jgi:hypothetical protein